MSTGKSEVDKLGSGRQLKVSECPSLFRGAAVRRKRRKSEWRLGAAGAPYRVYVRGKEVFGQQEIRLGVKKSSGVRVEEQRR